MMTRAQMAAEGWPARTAPRITAAVWAGLPIAERAELIGAVEEIGEAVAVALERAGLVVEEYRPGAYRCVPARR